MVEKKTENSRIFISPRIWSLPIVPTDILGMVGHVRLGVGCDVTLACYVCRVLRERLHHLPALVCLQLCALSGRVGARRRLAAISVTVERNNPLKFAPLSFAIRIINIINTKIDIYKCSLPKFTELAQSFIISVINSKDNYLFITFIIIILFIILL